MKITKISVKGLFGIFNHEIPLNTKEKITIIHGLNGFGKTSIFKLLDGVFNSKYFALIEIPFDNLVIEFDDSGKCEVIKSLIPKDGSNNDIRITIKYYSQQSNPNSFVLIDSQKQNDREKLALPSIDSISSPIMLEPNQIIYSSTRELILLNQLKEKFKNNILLKYKYQFELLNKPTWLKNLEKNVNIKFIEYQRLVDINNSSIAYTVSTYSSEIKKIIEDQLVEYGKLSESLDRTFPIRAVQQKPSVSLSSKQVNEQLNELENNRNYLTKLGLLDKDKNDNFPKNLQNIDKSTKNILSIYIEDTREKLNIFNTIAKKIELFTKIINLKFAYSYKNISFDKKQGLIFTAFYPNESKSELKTISPSDLSSGEQHELVLLYELLFKVESNSLILIDEPELSLHVAWQLQFLKDLKKITELADLDILMATHSPDIIQDSWDLTVELKAPEQYK